MKSDATNKNETILSGRCANCDGKFEKEDKYCRFCGTPRKEKEYKYKPGKIAPNCIYAPPMKTRHVCSKCGYKWTEITLGVDRAQFCPKCCGELNTESEPY